jgi:predicted transcriptional regulator
VAPPQQRLGRTEGEVLKLLWGNRHFGMSKNDIADRYLLAHTVEQVVRRVSRTLQRLTRRGLVQADLDAARGQYLFRVPAEQRAKVQELLQRQQRGRDISGTSASGGAPERVGTRHRARATGR